MAKGHLDELQKAEKYPIRLSLQTSFTVATIEVPEYVSMSWNCEKLSNGDTDFTWLSTFFQMQHSWNPLKIENLHVWFFITLMIWFTISQCFKRQQPMPWCWSWKIPLKENTPLCKTVIGVYKFCLGLKNTGASDIMTSWYGSAFQITGSLRAEFTDHQWIPPPSQNTSDTEFWLFLCC